MIVDNEDVHVVSLFSIGEHPACIMTDGPHRDPSTGIVWYRFTRAEAT